MRLHIKNIRLSREEAADRKRSGKHPERIKQAYEEKEAFTAEPSAAKAEGGEGQRTLPRATTAPPERRRLRRRMAKSFTDEQFRGAERTAISYETLGTQHPRSQRLFAEKHQQREERQNAVELSSSAECTAMSSQTSRTQRTRSQRELSEKRSHYRKQSSADTPLRGMERFATSLEPTKQEQRSSRMETTLDSPKSKIRRPFVLRRSIADAFQEKSAPGKLFQKRGDKRRTQPPRFADSQIGHDRTVSRIAPVTEAKKLRIKNRQQRYRFPAGSELARMQTTVVMLGKQLETAEKNLPTRKKIKLKRTFNEATGRGNVRLRFEEEIKPIEIPRSRLLTAPAHRLGGYGHNHIHQRINEAEQENVAIQGAHESEKAGEWLLFGFHRRLQSVRHHQKLKPYRTVEKLRHVQRTAQREFSIARTARKQPEIHSRNPITRLRQKRRNQRRYAQALRGARRGAQASIVQKATAKAIVSAQNIAIKNWKSIAVVLIVMLLLFQVMNMVSGIAAIASQMFTATLASTYTAEDTDITNSDLLYSRLEAELEERVLLIPETMPGYDEYRYELDAIGHNPFELISYLSARYEYFTFGEVERELHSLFQAQYLLETQVIVEIRYRTESYTYVDLDGNLRTGSRQVPYNYYIIEVTLTAKSLEPLLLDRLEVEQRERYSIFMDTLGARQFYGSPLPETWRDHISSLYGYRQHPFDGGISLHRGLDLANPTGTPIASIHDGTVIFVQPSDSNDFGLYVIVEDKHGLRSVYAHCSRILVDIGQQVKRGEIIAEVGNSGLSTGSHVHIELIERGEYLNPLFFMQGY